MFTILLGYPCTVDGAHRLRYQHTFYAAAYRTARAGFFLSALASILFLHALRVAQGTEFTVAPNGSDHNPGTLASPFATLERARDAVRQWKLAGQSLQTGAVISLRAGTYYRQESFVLNAQDAGVVDSPVVYRAYPGETVNVSGGIDLPLGEFAIVTDKRILARVPEESRGKLRFINLKERGYHEYGQLSLFGASVLPPYTVGPNPPELFVNGQVMTLARWPNSEYALVDSVVESGANLRMWQADMVGRDDRRGTYVPPEKREDPP
jgi:hypothetical protein